MEIRPAPSIPWAVNPQEIRPWRIEPPRLDLGLPITHWALHLKVKDSSVVLESEQTLHNTTSAVAEAVYLFPLPHEAVARDLELWIDGKPVMGEVLTRDKATEVYESIVRRQRDPALLEFADRDLVRARIFPIQPNADAHVRMKVVWTARNVGSLRSLEIPLYAPAGDPTMSMHLQIDSTSALGPIFSPSHPLDVVRKGTHHASASWEGRSSTTRRATIYYGASEEGPGISLLCHKTQEVGHFLVTLFSPGTLKGARVPRDVVFVLDRSGSMKDGKMEQAIAAMQHGIATLDSSDRFEVISFATEPLALFRGLVAADEGHRSRANEHLSQLRQSGGTALSDALNQALQTLRDSTRLSVVVLLTDGEPTIGETEPEKILQQASATASANVRLFCFGVGHDLNARLLDRLAETLRGASDYVLPNENLELRVSAFFDRIAQPALERVQVEFQGVAVQEVYPRRIGDLFVGSSIHLLGVYHGSGAAKVILRGQTPRGPFEQGFGVSFSEIEKEHDSILPLYASRKVAFLMEEIRLHGLKPELRDEVIRLGREYGIVTPYTSALVVEEGVQLAQRFGLPAPIPETGSFAGFVAGTRASEIVEDHLEALGYLELGREAVETSAQLSRLTDAAELKPRTEWTQTDSDRTTPQVRHVRGKTFLKVGATWIDRSLDAALWTGRKTIESFSDEYFAVLRDVPDLRRYVALGVRVIVQKENVVYEFVD